MGDSVPADIHLHSLRDGRNLAWRQFGEGAPLVMLHGWSMSGAVFTEIAENLSANFQVYCPDLSGHGWSESGGSLNLETLTDDLVDWLTALSIEDPALLGWSLGGQVAMRLAQRHDLSVERLVLVSTTPCFCQKEDWPHGLTVTQVRSMNRQLQRSYLKTLGDFFDLQFSEDEISETRRRDILAFAIRASRLPDPADCMDALAILSGEDLRESLIKITCPTLILHGRADQIVPCGAGEYLAESISGAQFHQMPGVGHAPFMSTPEECEERVRSFLR